MVRIPIGIVFIEASGRSGSPDVIVESAFVGATGESVFPAGDSSSRRTGNISTCARMNVRSGRF